MFRLADDLRVYLHRDPIDFRAGINGLAFFETLASMSASAHLIQMFDSTIVRAHVSAAGANVWPAPLQATIG